MRRRCGCRARSAMSLTRPNAMSAPMSFSIRAPTSIVAAALATIDVGALIEKLIGADIAFGRVSDMADLARHPHLRRIRIETPHGPVSYPAPARLIEGETRRYGPVPALGQHTEHIRAEFMSS